MLVSILTILMSGVVAGIVTFTLNARQSERNFMREKLEALFMHNEKYTKVLATTFLDYYGVLRGEMSMEQLLDMHNKRLQNKESHHDKVEMLIAVYFPNIYSAYQELMTARKEVAEITITFRRSYDSGDKDGLKFLSNFDGAMKRLFSASDSLSKEILAQAKHVNAPLWALWR